ncbi:MAG: beta-1,3-glucanase family protein [Candidatus Saccharimonas sp.]
MAVFARRLQLAVETASTSNVGLSAPRDVLATPNDGEVTLWWTTSDSATGYEVQYRLSAGGSWQHWAHNDTVTHAIVTGLVNGMSYDLRVRATNDTSISNWSTVVSGVEPIAANNSGGGLPTELDVTLTNRSSTDTVYAYIIGLSPINMRWTLVTADGQSAYQPPTPAQNHTPLAQDCAIELGAAGAAGRAIKVPRLISGRIFFSYDEKMHFFMDNNGGFVMPSEKNVSDPNIDIQWTFAEFTFNNVELYGNISFVDVLSIPLAFELETSDGSGRQYVPGLPSGAMDRIGARLLEQKQQDDGDWDKCLYYNNNDILVRILSPNDTVQIHPMAFSNYLDPYIDLVWAKYTSEDLTVNTNRVEWGDKVGRVQGGLLDFGDEITFAKPSTQSIWSCSIPPWTTGNDEQGNMTARLTAAFNRTTLLTNSVQPNGENPATYYTYPLTNHYSRIVHEEVYGNLGYAFPYDDVHPEGGISYEGRVQSSHPFMWTITVGRV